MRQNIQGKILLILITFFIFLFSFKDSSAQSQFLDVVWLKNGQYIKGLIISGSLAEKFKIIDIYGREFTIEWNEIDRIEKENYNRERFLGYAENYLDSAAMKKPYSVTLKGGYMRVMNYTTNNASASLIVSYNFTNISVGVGTMYAKFDKIHYFPIFADVRYTFNFLNIKPFFFAEAGYSVGKDDRRGVMFAMGTGVKYQLNNIFAFLVDMTYYYQAENYISKTFRFKSRYDSVLLNAGIQF